RCAGPVACNNMLNRYYKYQFSQCTGKTRPVKAPLAKVCPEWEGEAPAEPRTARQSGSAGASPSRLPVAGRALKITANYSSGGKTTSLSPCSLQRQPVK